MGATATGKTDLAVHIAERLPVEIISVDSALIYRDMDIGTAKPAADVLEKAPHHLIDILDPAQSWSVWEFMQTTLQLIDDIQARGSLPLLVGGTMMYFNALEQGMNDLPVADPAVREQLQARLQTEGLSALYEQLAEVDPDTAQRLKPADTQRILRALEVFLVTGRTMTSQLGNNPVKPDIEFTRVILDVEERKPLHQRIEQRFHLMLEQGFEAEVATLRKRADLNLQMPSMRCVGYRQMWEYLDGNYDHAQMVDKSVAATRQLAKRQLTWLRKYQQVTRLNYADFSPDEVINLLRRIEKISIGNI